MSIIAAIALILTPGLLFHFDVTPKVVVLLVGTSLALLFFRKTFAELRALTKTKVGLWFTVVLIAQLAWTAFVSLHSAFPELSLFGGAWRRLGLVTFAALVVLTLVFAAQMAGSASLILDLLRVVVVTGAMLSLYGVLQYFKLDPLMSAQAYLAGEGAFQIVRPPGTFGHADYFATWLVFVVFAGVATGLCDRDDWMRTAAWVTVAGAILAALLTGTRAALLGLAAGSVILVAYRTVPRKRLVIAAMAGVALLGILAVSPAGTRLRARVHWSGDDLRGGARLLIWRDSLKLAMNQPLTGLGPETFSLRFPQYESEDLARAYPDFYHESPHNILIDELTAKGVPGLLLFLAFVLVAIFPAPISQGDNRLMSCLLSAFVALFVCQQFSVFVTGTAFAFYLCAAMLVAVKLPPPVAGAISRPPVIWFAILSAALSICFGVFAAKLTVGDYYLARVDGAIKHKDIEAAGAWFDKAVRWLPPGPAEDLYFSRTLASVAMGSPVFPTQTLAWHEALKHGIRAVKTSEDRQNAWYSLASMLARENDTSGVERALRSAIAWAPNWFKPHWTLAEVLALSGHPAEASMEAKRALDLDGGRDPEVSATYRRLSAP
jgi:O-antigen ligase